MARETGGQWRRDEGFQPKRAGKPVRASSARASFLSAAAALFDGVFVPRGEASVSAVRAEPGARRFIRELYRHGKPVGGTGAGVELVTAALQDDSVSPGESPDGIVFGSDREAALVAAGFVEVMKVHRAWAS